MYYIDKGVFFLYIVIVFSEYLKKSQENKDKNDKEVNSLFQC